MFFKGFYISSSGGHFVQQSRICSTEQNHFSNFGKGVLEEHFCEIILQLGPWPKRRCYLKIFFFFFCSGCHFSVLVEGHSRNIPVKLFQNPLTGLGDDVFKVNCCQMHDNLHPFSIFSSGGNFVKPKGTILAILVKGHKRNISVKLFWNQVKGLRRDVV